MRSNNREKVRRGYRELRWDHPRVVESPIDHLALRDRPYSWTGEHRVVMSYELGRELDTEEHVHHIDGNRLNNIPRNLIVLHRQDHTRKHDRLMRELLEYRKRDQQCVPHHTRTLNRKSDAFFERNAKRWTGFLRCQ